MSRSLDQHESSEIKASLDLASSANERNPASDSSGMRSSHRHHQHHPGHRQRLESNEVTGFSSQTQQSPLIQQPQRLVFYPTAGTPGEGAWVIPYQYHFAAAAPNGVPAHSTANPASVAHPAAEMNHLVPLVPATGATGMHDQHRLVPSEYAFIPATAFRLGPVPMAAPVPPTNAAVQSTLAPSTLGYAPNAPPYPGRRAQSPPPSVNEPTAESYKQYSHQHHGSTKANDKGGFQSGILHNLLPEKEMKSIVDQAIVDRRNVYIRGLPPAMNDESMLKLCQKFGNVVSVKTIVEQIPTRSVTGDLTFKPGPCKGYGFALFETGEMAARCVRDVVALGYQASFAKESFSSKLKSLRDGDTTNIYLSNLPSCMDEKALEQLLEPIAGNVLSSKILRDQQTGKSRGVGFARVASRDVASECIQHFHNMLLPGISQPIQLRFADNSAQRKLKGRAHQRRTMYIQQQTGVVPAAQLIPVYPACFSSPEDQPHAMMAGYFDGAPVPMGMPDSESAKFGSSGSQANSSDSGGAIHSSHHNVVPSIVNSGSSSHEPPSNSGNSSHSNSVRNVSWSNSDQGGSHSGQDSNSFDISPASCNDKEDPLAKAGKKVAAEYARGFADKGATHERKSNSISNETAVNNQFTKTPISINHKNKNDAHSGEKCSNSDNSDNDCDDDLTSAVKKLAVHDQKSKK